MINTYYTTSMISTSTRSYLSMNNYSNETYPSSYCCNSTKLFLTLPLNSSLVCPPTQSSLIHWAPPSRLLLGLGGGYGFREPGFDVGRCYFVESCCGRGDMMWGRSYGVKCCGSKEGVGVGSRRGRGGYGFCGPGCDVGRCYFGESCCGREDMMWDRSYGVKCCRSKKGVGVGSKRGGGGGRGRGRIGRSGYRSNVLGDAEAMLSLLAEETVEVCLEGRENRSGVSKRGKVVEEHIVVCEEFDDRKNGREDGCLYSGNEVEKLGLGRGRVRSKEEGRKRRGEVERLSMGQDLSSRRNESSSSNYSLLDFESDGEDEVEKVGAVVIREESRKDSKRYSDKNDQQFHGSSVLDHSKVGSSTDWDCRKKSEKKLAVEIAEETKSKKDFVLQQSHSSKVSSPIKHFNRDERESTSGVNSHWQSWSHVKTNDQESAYSKSSSRHQQVTETNINDARTVARRRSEVGEGVVVIGKTDQETECEFCKSCGSTMQENKSESEQHAEVSDSRENGGWTVSGQVNSGRRSQYYNEMVGADGRYDESTLRTQRWRVESGMKNVEEQSTSLVSGHGEEWMREESVVKTIEGNEAIKISHRGLSVSQAHSRDTEIGNLSVSQQRLYDEQAFLASRLKSVEEEISKQKQIDERTRQSTCKSDVQGHVWQAGFAQSPSGKAIGTQPSVTLISQTAVQQVSQVEDTSNIHISVVGPSYQFIEGSKYGQPSAGVVRHDSYKITGKAGIDAYVRPHIEFASSSHDAHGSVGLSYEESSPSETLGSVSRMEETSNQIVGEYVEKMKHDASASDTGMEKTSSHIDSSNEDNNPLHETEGPSDEKCDVKDHFTQAPSEMESLESATSEDSVPKRTGKSLWNVVAGIFRWGPQSETRKSLVKTSGQSPSNETGSGQTYFSGNEHDEANGDSLRTEESNMSEQTTSSDKLALQRNAASSSDNGTKRVEEDAPSYSGACVGASTDTNFIQEPPQSTPSDAFEEVEEAGQNKGVISSTKKQKKHAVSVRQGSGLSEASDVELEQRKLQRSKQFQQERFEAWEDGYRRENEQRKVDEIFMREALVEARKASDSWEVPVGAVLVQNGKIIARGYNLVEELRDSTAHAEMICIREASSVLKTWRLSETTLYVTLEPCPMCAGAILQARVGTVVWGAPNKLLGADGSWIRLFPEEEQRPEVSDKAAAPVHPFHPKMKIRRGVLEAECAGIMQEFFKLRRRKEKGKKQKGEEVGHSSCLPVPHRPRFFHKFHGAFHFLFRL